MPPHTHNHCSYEETDTKRSQLVKDNLIHGRSKIFSFRQGDLKPDCKDHAPLVTRQDL